jgi:hypothetical protein
VARRSLEHDVYMSEKLTLNELFALFGRTPEQTRWLSSAESEEYLSLVTYLVARQGYRNRVV